jgi:hypothetical protein
VYTLFASSKASLSLEQLNLNPLAISASMKLDMDFFRDLSIELATSRCEKLQAPSYLNLTLSM